jgi:FAD synthase
MKYLRQEKKFNSSEELSFQINEDIKKAKIFFSSLRKNNKN